MKNKKILTIVHLYPKEMNIYGDMGNILTLKVRSEKRGHEVNVINIGLGELDNKNLPIGDIYFMGGGQDDDMYKVFEDLLENKKKFIISEVEKGKVFLLICGAFQLFGKYFMDSEGRQMDGLNLIILL
jgi:CobQ-like glutamine amidotransferase family enzyme